MAAARLLFSSLLFVSVIGTNFVTADDGQPIAIRHWPGGGITIETQWGINIGLEIDDSTEKQLESKLDFKLDSLKPAESVVLSRAPNSAKVTLARENDPVSYTHLTLPTKRIV